jgi:glutamate/tyrosine decarboxylase-like PLP-dependent enzyme
MQEPTRASIRSILSKSTLFASLLPEELDHLASICTTRQLPTGAVLFREGDPGDAMFEELAQHLEAMGWFAPVYHLPPDNDQIEVMRIVVRAHFNRALARAFLHDLKATVQQISMISIYT